MPLPIPPLGAFRIAAPSDILRIGIVAASSFRYSPVFDWERPYHEKYPQDTLLSYRQEFSTVMRSPEHIVLVAFDRFDPEEDQKTKAIIPADNGWQKPAPWDEVIVGIGCWKLEPGSKRIGDFQNDNGTYPDLPPNQDRDKNAEHAEAFGEGAEAAEKKYFHGFSTMEMLVVHPAYWKRGHGRSLTGWGMELAKIDGVQQGVIAAEMGKAVYGAMGFKNLEDLHWDGDDIVPQGLTVSAMLFNPNESTGKEVLDDDALATGAVKVSQGVDDL